MFVLSMIVYGVAFDFFNISGSLFVDNSTEPALRSSAQGLFMLMTNGVGATVGTLAAQAIVNAYTHPQTVGSDTLTVGDWQFLLVHLCRLCLCCRCLICYYLPTKESIIAY